MTIEIHDVSTASNTRLVDVVFVHGLGGSWYGTWGYNGNNAPWNEGWAKWLLDAAACDINIFSLSYSSSAIKPVFGDPLTIIESAKVLRQRLKVDGFGRVPIIFVCHSLGGLLIKQMLRHDAIFRQSVFGKPVSLVFIGTPHRGSRWATRLNFLFSPFVSSHVAFLARMNVFLDDLNEWFTHQESHVNVSNFYEKGRMLGIFRIVDEESARLAPFGHDFCDERDHVALCKPSTARDLIVRTVASEVVSLARTSVPAGGLSSSVLERFSFLELYLSMGRWQQAFAYIEIGRLLRVVSEPRQVEALSNLLRRGEIDHPGIVEDAGVVCSVGPWSSGVVGASAV